MGGADAHYIMSQIYLSQFSIVTRTSWLNCVLRGDDGKEGKECAESVDIALSVLASTGWYLVVLGQYRAILVESV